MSAEAIEITKLKNSCRELAGACQKRAKERDEYWSDRLLMQVLDHERRMEISRLLGVSDMQAEWPFLMTRLNECLTTFRRRPTSAPHDGQGSGAA